MFGTLAIIISLSTLIFTAILLLLSSLDIVTLGILVVSFNILQWLISPYIIDALYRTRELPENENPKLHEAIENLSKKSNIKKPKLMLAQIPIPNAFAYGSPIAGTRVAVTSGLLKTLEADEVEAVIGHELGHLKHRDVQIMMFVSLLPALLTYMAYSLMFSSMYRQREGSSGGAALGIGLMFFAWILNMFILYLSRLREYYADRHSSSIVDDGSRKLSEGLAKIVNTTKNMRKSRKEKQNLTAFKALFITDPDHAETDFMAISTSTMAISSDQKLVQGILSQKLTTMDRIVEIFSTHPNIIKRLKALQESS
jgi:heat shock protein HtpX